MKKLIIANIVTIALLAIIGIVGFHFYSEATNFVKTDNAKVDGEQMKISSPTPGQVKSTELEENKTFDKDDKVAEVMGQGKDGSPQKNEIKMPNKGTIVKSEAKEGSMVQAGKPFAYAYNLDDLYITANVDENSIKDVEEGQDVDVTIDGQKSTVNGEVKRVGKATASSFSLMPSSNSDGNYTKVSQVVPVKIELDSLPEDHVVPGMNAEVRIHKN
ncbi:HlyD family secretion protein [Staphylococcus massiliensis]|uniref:Multidrug resistance protein n=1 Tax=Staphylococcus massiliensis S46 TaxID=1229783 RepID=K9ASJ8_9STAP|nr:HlyD family efflux transporter periplasmic adaptor subunit [Staphylococcus massiliensis]EKU49046.1 Multidrug resistance protein [Staphylococcus massiliensis S46]MCG3399487.1 HlyD family efflux transporter periplasmic adaptor subunit [Staphylococcus massiliensis]MCG3402413.1 HlyD family efflux transporter periplasmic adaptor subunit [Staphylococcus massiliensis]MCG3411623.1 HlyD family efflux transporter periplasmic adaptor subunit [Staphylococcus massiliensis]POA01465.1 HlyD family secretio